jgi:hypothetical protein
MADEFTATPGRSWRGGLPESDPPARVQAKWNHFADEDSRQINMLEQILCANTWRGLL